MIHWMMVVIFLGALVSGLCLWDKSLQQYVHFVFVPENIGVIHIGFSVAIVAAIVIYLSYLNHKNFLSFISIKGREFISKGRLRWRNINILLYWIVGFVLFVETVTGVLLTKLINKDVLFQVFSIQRDWLLVVHLYFTWLVASFPIMHVFIHWKDGGLRKILSILQPKVLPNRPTLIDAMSRLKEENTRLKKEMKETCSSK